MLESSVLLELLLTDLASNLSLIIGLALCIVLGANNLSTCLGTSIGTRVLRYRHALALAAIGILAGTLLEGGKMSKAITSGIVSSSDPKLVLSVTLSSLLIMGVLTFRKLPISLSQVAIGATVGSGFALGIHINWQFALLVGSSWLLTPLSGLMIAIPLSIISRMVARRLRRILVVNALYAYLAVFSGIYASYALGANTVGLIIGMMGTSQSQQLLVSILFGLGAIAGMVAFSRGTTRSVAENIVGLSPSASFAAQMGGALTVHGFTQAGIPVSVSQAVIGGIFGAAIPRKVVVRNDRLTREILLGWTLAPLLGAFLSLVLTLIM